MNNEKNLEYDEKEIRFHIVKKNLTLKECANCMLLINKSINDVNRYLGVSNRYIRDYATEIVFVQNGSMIIDTIVKIYNNIVNNEDEIKDFGKDVAKSFFVTLLVTLMLNNTNDKNTINYKEFNNINITKIENSVIIGEEYISNKGLYSIKVIDKNTIEITINDGDENK